MADVSVDASVSTSTARGLRSAVFVSATVGYRFYIDSGGTFVYSKTSDGGATWGAAVTIAAATTHVAFDVWFDKWTPGDAGTLIHTWYFDTTNDRVIWRSLDTNGDTLGTARTVFQGASAVAGNNAYVSGTKARSGYLYCCSAIDASNEQYFGRSTDSGTTWSAALSTTFQEANPDHAILFPASGTGDNNDIWAIYHDSSVQALTMKMWDSSAAAQVESSTVQTNIAVGTDLTVYQYPYSGSIRHSDGHLIVVSMSSRDLSTSDMQVWDVGAVNAGSQTGITAKTDITTNIDDNYHPQIFIDQATNDIYVAYNGKRDGSEVLGTTTKVYYTKSSDGGTSWSAGDTAYMEGAAGVVVQVWAPLSGFYFYASWRVGTTLLGNKVNAKTLNIGSPSAALASQASSVAGSGKSETTSTDGSISAQASSVAGSGKSETTSTDGSISAQNAAIFGTGTAESNEEASLTGTALPNINDEDVVAGGKTIIITLTGDTWLVSAGGLFDAVRQDIIDGLNSAGAEAHGWNVEVRDKQSVAGVVRTSDTIVTIALDAQAAYSINADETITVTVPASATLLGLGAVATPTFDAKFVITSIGELVAQAASVDGTSTSLSTGIGTLTDQAASLAGAGKSLSTGTGALAAQAATFDGSAESRSTGTGALQPQAAALDGETVSLSTGTGALVSERSAITGSGDVPIDHIEGAGALNAHTATVVGAGLVTAQIIETPWASELPLEELQRRQSATGEGMLIAFPSKVKGRGEVSWSDQNNIALLLLAA